MAADPPPPRPRRRRLRRIGCGLVLLLVVLPLLVVLGTLGALRAKSVRQSILGRVSRLLAADYGLAFSAADFSPRWRAATVELRDVRLGAPGVAPLATAERLRARVDLGTLRSRPLVVRRLEADGLRIDLAAPLPRLPERPAAAAAAGPPVEIRRIVVSRGEVRGVPLAKPAGDWLRSWSASGIAAGGSYRAGVLELSVERAETILERPAFGRQRLQVAVGRVRYDERLPLRVEGLRVTGDGLRLVAAGSVGLVPGAHTAVDFDLRAESRALAAGLPRRGTVAASGRLALPENRASVRLSATDLPAEALRPYLAPALFAKLSLAGTSADLRGAVALGPGDWARVDGHGDAAWRRGARPLARVRLRVAPGEAAAPIVATVSGALLPDSAGRRTVEGTLRAAGWNEIADATAEGLRAEVRVPDVAAALAEARSLWPQLVPALPAEAPLHGALLAGARLDGPLTAPTAAAEATWLPRPGARLRVEAKGSPRAWTGTARLRAEAMPLELLAPLAPGLAGDVDGTAELSGSALRGYRTRIDAAAAGFGLPIPLADGPATAVAERLYLTADGQLRLSPLRWEGAAAVDGEAAALEGRGGAKHFRLATAGTLRSTPPSYLGTATLTGDDLEMQDPARQSQIARIDHLELAADGKAGSALRTVAARARLEVATLTLTEQQSEIRELHLEVDGDGREVRLTRLSGELTQAIGGAVGAATSAGTPTVDAPTLAAADGAAPPAPRTFAGSGRVTLDPLLAAAELELHLVRPHDAITAAALSARLHEGVLDVEAPAVETAAGEASFRAHLPLGALRKLPRLTAALAAFPGTLPDGPLTLSLQAPALDSRPLLAALGMPPRPERVQAGLDAELSLDLAAPAAGRGEVRLSALDVETAQGRVRTDAPAVLRLDGGRLALLPVHLRIDGGMVKDAGVDLQATADLAATWRPFEDPLTAAVTQLAAAGRGTVDASFLNPYLEGGIAEGSLSFAGSAEGPPDRLVAAVSASGLGVPGASFVWPGAGIRIEQPTLALDLRDGRWTIGDGRANLNGGTVELAGGVSSAGDLAIETRLANVRYRLQYGIDTQLSGALAFHAPPQGRSLLSGRVVVDRGVLDRDLDLDREVLTMLLAPPATPSTEEDALAAIDLDLAVETTDGVRVSNNVGDLRASWRRLTLDGTLRNPVLRGRIEIDPGGVLCAYGQALRIDRGSLSFTGDPLTDPQMEMTTTSSLQDPEITCRHGASPLDLLDQQSDRALGAYAPGGQAKQASTGEMLSSGLTSYYGAQLVDRLSRSIGLGGLSVRPALVFEETDPSARLTVGRELSRNIAVALSLDLRNTQRQTYLLYVTSVPGLPGLRLEGFTGDAGHHGSSLQQSFELGGDEPRREETGPRLRRIAVSTPQRGIVADVLRRRGISKRQLRNAIRLQRKQPVPAGAAFGVEVDLAELLRRKGYPDPRIQVALPAVAERPGWVDLAVTVEPGPKVDFVFAGDKPPRALRAPITALYRTDFYEPIAVEEMRQAAVRAFRANGRLDPQVTIEVQRRQPGDADGRRTVTVRAEAGPRRSLAALEIAGVDEPTARLAAASFKGTLARAELAAALPTADRLLLASLRALGYPQAKVSGRALGDDGSRLVVSVEPGPRQLVAAVEVHGVAGAERERLAALLPIRAGDPARLDLVSAGALVLAGDLRRRGYADVAVRSAVTEAPAERPHQVAVAYEVTPGIPYRLAGVEVSGARRTRQTPMLREADLDTGTPFDEAKVDEARTRLFRTGAFSRVDADVAKRPDGEARVTFSLGERAPYRIGYGVRWESSVGTAAVLDLVDQNLLGRALTLGLRGLYQRDDRSGRLYLRTRGLLGTKVSLESYASRRQRTFPDDNLVEDTSELALQASRPLGTADTARLYLRYRSSHLYEIEPDPFFAFDVELNLPYMGAQLVHDSRDDGIDPGRGLLASLDLSGSGSFLGSDLTYLRLLVQAAHFQPVALGGRRLTWAQALRLGVAHPFAGQDVVRDERFFAGGPFSVRGYDRDSLGPVESLGSITRANGGEAFAALNEELRVALPWDLTALAFFDAGQVWVRPGDAGFDFAKALGLGLRAHTPLGLLRFDAAYPLDRRPGDDRYKLYFGFGNAF